MDISEIIKTRREELDLKVKDVAKSIGVAESTYREWENGRKIQGEPYVLISQILNISVGELLGINRRESIQNVFTQIEIIEKHVKTLQQNVTQIL
jgi:transcriptional regulator with XRE-family HTH domain